MVNSPKLYNVPMLKDCILYNRDAYCEKTVSQHLDAYGTSTLLLMMASFDGFFPHIPFLNEWKCVQKL